MGVQQSSSSWSRDALLVILKGRVQTQRYLHSERVVESGQLVKEPTQTGKGIWRGMVQKQMNCVGADVMFELWKGKQ